MIRVDIKFKKLNYVFNYSSFLTNIAHMRLALFLQSTLGNAGMRKSAAGVINIRNLERD